MGTMGIWRLLCINEYIVCVLGGWAGLFCGRYSGRSVLTEIILIVSLSPVCMGGRQFLELTGAWAGMNIEGTATGGTWSFVTQEGLIHLLGLSHTWPRPWMDGLSCETAPLCEMRAPRLWISLSCLLWVRSLSPQSPHGGNHCSESCTSRGIGWTGALLIPR